MTILAVGSMAYDSIKTPFATREKVLGGSVNHFSISAAHFTKVQCVSVVGEDYPEEHMKLLADRGIDTKGIQRAKGKTFHWEGSYGHDLHEAQTLNTCLNVFENFTPTISKEYKKAPFVFLGNISPELQLSVLSQIEEPRFIGLDSMNFWIEGKREKLIEALQKCHAVILNEGEVRQLTKTYNIVDAAQQVRAWGPQILVIKRGEYGAILFDHGEAFSLPGLPLALVKDPTGAGDAFAGGFMGYLASQASFSISGKLLRRAVVYGSVMASFMVQDFSFLELLKVNRTAIEERFQKFLNLTHFHEQNA